MRCVHYVGFRDDRFLNALKVFGGPAFVHRIWDMRARREIADDDLVVFANGPADQEPQVRSADDYTERDDPARKEVGR